MEISQTITETLSYEQTKLKEQRKGETDERIKREGKRKQRELHNKQNSGTFSVFTQVTIKSIFLRYR
jgi:hypothetical protein